jgi:hypothetical protein
MGSLLGYFPLQEQVGALRTAPRVVQQLAKNGRGQAEGWVGDHAERFGGQLNDAEVSHKNANPVRKPEGPQSMLQPAGPYGIAFQSQHARASRCQRDGQRTRTGADL